MQVEGVEREAIKPNRKVPFYISQVFSPYYFFLYLQ